MNLGVRICRMNGTATLINYLYIAILMFYTTLKYIYIYIYKHTQSQKIIKLSTT